MDPLSQGIMGSVGANQLSQKKQIGIATFLGFMSGLAPDLDIFIRSDTDPLLMLEFHRQFTHSLLFIPFGGLACALFFFLIYARKKLSFRKTYLFCTLGYATHALLDSCTTYGTQLFWPFSDTRFAWNNVSIIDPLFTLPILIFVLINLKLKSRLLSIFSLFWAIGYLSLGVVQRERAEVAAWRLIETRGIEVSDIEAKPSFGNLLVWKIISTTAKNYYVDAVKLSFSKEVFFEGEVVDRLDLDRDFPDLDKHSQQARDIERFRWFSDGYLAVSPSDSSVIIDMRYSMLPNEVKGLWGIRISESAPADQHVEYIEMTDRSGEHFRQLWHMITAPK